MNAEYGQMGFIHVKLSDRNLLDLLGQRMGYGVSEGEYASLVRKCDNLFLQVTVESNHVHYKGRHPGPGGLVVG
jgi:hypothetical protein